MVEDRRRLAAILAADVAGYSRLMGDDERATVTTLNAYRDVFGQEVSRHAGRVVDTAGDSVLAMFESVVEAVQCALNVQTVLAERNEALADDRKMRFRIGINLGDIIEQDDGNVYGDGINVAARLEALATPGGVAVSESAHMQIRDKLAAKFTDAGEHSVKNIARPIRVFMAMPGDGGQAVAPAANAHPTLPDKPSIAVLPLDNLSGDPDQEYFADGIAEDLITGLSHIRWLFVTARNSTFTYKGTSPDIRNVGRDLGVRYVLEGSVRSGGKRVRITAQLIDAVTGNHVWADRFDRELEDIFAVQDEITDTIIRTIEPQVSAAERERARRKPPGSLDAWESYQRGLWHMWKYNDADNAEARRHFERATDLDPRFAPGHTGLAYTHLLDATLFHTESAAESLSRALTIARQALAHDDRDTFAHITLGRILTYQGKLDAAIAALEHALDLSGSAALAHLGLGAALHYAGRSEEAITALDTAARLSPHDPYQWLVEASRAMALFSLGDFGQALDYAQRAVRHPLGGFWPHVVLAAALSQQDRMEEARAALRAALDSKPDLSLRFFEYLKRYTRIRNFDGFMDAVRKAGLE